MNDLILNQNQTNGGVITLKEITDIIEVRHDKAMIKVEQLAKEPSFGEVSKMDTFNLSLPYREVEKHNPNHYILNVSVL